MTISSEFKEFVMKGNVMDLAVGVIIGAAFGKIVDSLVGDIIMPVVSFITGGGFDFRNLFIVMGNIPPDIPHNFDALKKAGVPILAYGSFITVLINFVILAFVIFMIVRTMNRTKRDEAPAPVVAPPEDITLLREIRDSLKKV